MLRVQIMASGGEVLATLAAQFLQIRLTHTFKDSHGSSAESARTRIFEQRLLLEDEDALHEFVPTMLQLDLLHGFRDAYQTDADE